MSSRLVALVLKLQKHYGELPSPPADAFALFVWEILSGHSKPKKRDGAFAMLKRHRLLTADAMWKAAPKTLEASVALAGPYRDQRLLGLRKGVEVFRRNPSLPSMVRGPTPTALRLLKQLPRMTGDSSAYRMLLFAGGHAVLPVDARVSRVATRLGYGEQLGDFSKTARSVRQAVTAELRDSVDAFRRTYVYLEHHGAAICTEANPHCDECPLFSDCPYGQSRAMRRPS
jgi:endonuclease III